MTRHQVVVTVEALTPAQAEKWIRDELISGIHWDRPLPAVDVRLRTPNLPSSTPQTGKGGSHDARPRQASRLSLSGSHLRLAIQIGTLRATEVEIEILGAGAVLIGIGAGLAGAAT